ncbi:MAG: hypothetical protein JWN79_602 [Gemmatimonadetes bacterium]|nr:hypothetical protein [Gemmatimonadota bacterium]
MADQGVANRCSGQVVDAALKVHSVLGPGLLETAYAACLAHELAKRGCAVVCQAPIPLIYDSVRMETGYLADLIVDGMVVVELKAVATLLPVHSAQLLSYLRLSGCRVGLLMNFHEAHLRDGIKRFVDGY